MTRSGDALRPAPGLQSATVRSVAAELSCADLISRAISFDAKLSTIWDVSVEWNWRLKSSAGWCRYTLPPQIALHPGLRQREPDEMRGTFLHEVAHAAAVILYGSAGAGHGQFWWEAMIRLGQQPWKSRYHNINECRQRVERTLESDKTLAELDL